ncbi:chemotaxis protein CheW [Synechocystis sp. PCC 7509]|uniref:chemotaxis protein CheW n=1 Tax=Synechocystis sp. PCC 7509 TaxID=927677 RepID=UPI0002AD02E4|nr:chemotaxis protein CheW [Synechocystis sp. PCC 7509]
MENKSYLVFSLDNLKYGIDALLVQEIFYLPELIPIVEAPNDIVGLLNLRGKIVPVMHLSLRLGNQLEQCYLTDSIIVLDYDGLQVGIIVSNVHEVKNISPKLIENAIDYGRIKDINYRFLAGIAKVDSTTILLLNHHNLLREPEKVEALLEEDSQNLEQSSLVNNFYTTCCPNATTKEKTIFKERADNLKQLANDNSSIELIPLAVIGLNNEYFGIELEFVQEFTNIPKVTPIPCCPSHIVGNMNLRGEILTLVDIRSLLNMPLAKTSNGNKALVVGNEDLIAGFSVDEVFDVMYLHPSAVTSLPVAVNSKDEKYLRGTVAYLGNMLTILDLPKLLMNELLVVNETV